MKKGKILAGLLAALLILSILPASGMADIIGNPEIGTVPVSVIAYNPTSYLVPLVFGYDHEFVSWFGQLFATSSTDVSSKLAPIIKGSRLQLVFAGEEPSVADFRSEWARAIESYFKDGFITGVDIYLTNLSPRDPRAEVYTYPAAAPWGIQESKQWPSTPAGWAHGHIGKQYIYFTGLPQDPAKAASLWNERPSYYERISSFIGLIASSTSVSVYMSDELDTIQTTARHKASDGRYYTVAELPAGAYFVDKDGYLLDTAGKYLYTNSSQETYLTKTMAETILEQKGSGESLAGYTLKPATKWVDTEITTPLTSTAPYVYSGDGIDALRTAGSIGSDGKYQFFYETATKRVIYVKDVTRTASNSGLIKKAYYLVKESTRVASNDYLSKVDFSDNATVFDKGEYGFVRAQDYAAVLQTGEKSNMNSFLNVSLYNAADDENYAWWYELDANQRVIYAVGDKTNHFDAFYLTKYSDSTNSKKIKIGDIGSGVFTGTLSGDLGGHWVSDANAEWVVRADTAYHVGNYQFNDLASVDIAVGKSTNLSISASSRLREVVVESGGYLNLTKVNYSVLNSLFTKWIDRLTLKTGAIIDFPVGTTGEIAFKWLGDTSIEGVTTKVQNVTTAFKPGETPVPPVPAAIKIGASHASPTSVSLNWNAAAGATGYNLYQASSSAGTYQLIAANTTNLSAIATGLATGSYYWFKAAAVDAKGEIAASDPIQVRARPLRPASINAAAGSKTGSAKVSWGSVAECDGYAVYVSTSRTGAYTLKSVVSGRNSLSAQVTGLKSGATYYFKVASYVQVGPAKVPSVYTGVVSAKAK